MKKKSILSVRNIFIYPILPAPCLWKCKPSDKFLVSAGVVGPVILDEFGDIDHNLTVLYTSQTANYVRMSRVQLFDLIQERRNKKPCTIAKEWWE